MAQTGVNLLVPFAFSSSLAFIITAWQVFQCSLWFLEYRHCPLRRTECCSPDCIHLQMTGLQSSDKVGPKFSIPSPTFSKSSSVVSEITQPPSYEDAVKQVTAWLALYGSINGLSKLNFAVLSTVCLVDSDIEWAWYLPNRVNKVCSYDLKTGLYSRFQVMIALLMTFLLYGTIKCHVFNPLAF